MTKAQLEAALGKSEKANKAVNNKLSIAQTANEQLNTKNNSLNKKLNECGDAKNSANKKADKAKNDFIEARNQYRKDKGEFERKYDRDVSSARDETSKAEKISNELAMDVNTLTEDRKKLTANILAFSESSWWSRAFKSSSNIHEFLTTGEYF